MLQKIMMRILIVEDEEHLADLLAEVLGREGHVAKTASDGRSGLTRALSEDFELLVVDWMLPDLDGVQVVKRLRAAEVRVPILMLTARTQVEDRVEVQLHAWRGRLWTRVSTQIYNDTADVMWLGEAVARRA